MAKAQTTSENPQGEVSQQDTPVLPMQYDVRIHSRQANGLSCGSVILLEQLRTIDKSRLRERVGALDTSEMKQIDWALGVSVGLVEGYR